jgi:hypothetical protein
MVKNCVSNKGYGEILEFIDDRLNNGVKATLENNQEKMLNKVSNKLENMFAKKNMNFNSDGFKSTVRMCMSESFESSGGMMKPTRDSGRNPDKDGNDSNNQFVMKAKKSRIRFYMSDFIAILCFITSMYLVYLSFIDFGELIASLTGTDSMGFTEDIRQHLNNALNVFSDPEYILTYPRFLFSVLTFSATGILEGVVGRYRNIISRALSMGLENVMADVQRTCMTPNRGTFAGYVSGFVGATDPASAKCITSALDIATRRVTANYQAEMESLVLRIETRTSNIYTTISMAARLGWTSSSYLVWRISNGFSEMGALDYEVHYNNEVSRSRPRSHSGSRSRSRSRSRSSRRSSRPSLSGQSLQLESSEHAPAPAVIVPSSPRAAVILQQVNENVESALRRQPSMSVSELNDAVQGLLSLRNPRNNNQTENNNITISSMRTNANAKGLRKTKRKNGRKGTKTKRNLRYK